MPKTYNVFKKSINGGTKSHFFNLRVFIKAARPYESCKIFKGRPRRNAFSKLVHRQYKSFLADRFLSGGNQKHNWVE